MTTTTETIGRTHTVTEVTSQGYGLHIGLILGPVPIVAGATAAGSSITTGVADSALVQGF